MKIINIKIIIKVIINTLQISFLCLFLNGPPIPRRQKINQGNYKINEFNWNECMYGLVRKLLI